MPDDQSPPDKPALRSPGRRSEKGDQAFALWLERGLRKLYDDVAKEPVPDDLLRLIKEGNAPGRGE